MKKISFFKKVWYSITKIERYPEMAAQGFGKAIGYLALMVAILTAVICLGLTVQCNTKMKELANYLESNFPDFSYSDGILDVNSEEVIEVSEEDSTFGKIIIDTNETDEQTKNQYINDITKTGAGIIILKNETIIKVSGISGTSTYDYKTELEKFNVESFDKNAIVNYINSSKAISLCISIFLIFFIYYYIMLIILIAISSLYISIVGYLATLVVRMKIRYVAVYNMSIYSLTLSIALTIAYVLVNMFITFNITYFDVMYSAVAAIYMVAAILLLRENAIKSQIELAKIEEMEKIIREQKEEEEQKEKDGKEKEERKKKDEEEKQDNTGGEPCTFYERRRSSKVIFEGSNKNYG